MADLKEQAGGGDRRKNGKKKIEKTNGNGICSYAGYISVCR